MSKKGDYNIGRDLLVGRNASVTGIATFTGSIIGGTGVTDALTLQGTSGNGTLDSKAFEVLVGNNGATDAIFVNNRGQVGVGVTSFTANNRGLEVSGRSELRDQLHLGRDITGTGWQTYLSGWGFGAYRDFLALNLTTGRVGYIAGGGTQGHEIITVARPTRFNARSTTNNVQFTSATDSISYHLFGEAEFNNASAVYTAFRYNFIDTASSVDSKFFDMRVDNATRFLVRKDGQLQTYAGRIQNTTRSTAATYNILSTDHIIYLDTDSTVITANLPPGVAGTTYKIINVGSSGNDVTLVPNGSELLKGANASQAITDGNDLFITYETTEGWW
jgi:hypothetical protein